MNCNKTIFHRALCYYHLVLTPTMKLLNNFGVHLHLVYHLKISMFFGSRIQSEKWILHLTETLILTLKPLNPAKIQKTISLVTNCYRYTGSACLYVSCQSTLKL